MIVLVCGGRAYADRAFLEAELDRLHAQQRFARLVEGGSGRRGRDGSPRCGADLLARAWAEARGVPVTEHPALWRSEGLSAGFNRNLRMVLAERPELIVAFPGGRGTAHTCGLAASYRIPLVDLRSGQLELDLDGPPFSLLSSRREGPIS